MTELSAAQRERLLRESGVANDGLWFYAVQSEFGVEAANQLNASVVRKFATLEMARLLRMLRRDPPQNEEEFVELLKLALDLFVEGLFQANLERTPGRVHLKVTRCFAYEGVRRAGLHECYRCGPGQRLLGWLNAMDSTALGSTALGSTVQLLPEVGLCQMAHLGSCEYTLNFSTASAVDAPA